MPTDIRVLNGNVGPRWTYRGAKIPVAKRKQPLLDAFTNIPGGPPGILILQECVSTTDRFLRRELGYDGYGNGIDSRGPNDRDRSGDNGVILWDPNTWDPDPHPFSRVKYVGVGPTRTFVRVIRLTRRATGDTVRVMVTHPPNGVVSEVFRMRQVRELARYVKGQGSPLSTAVWGADWNSSKTYPTRGVRTMLEREFGMRDVERLLSADDFDGNSLRTHNGFKPTRRDGIKIDAIAIGERVRVRKAGIYRTDVPPQRHWSCDHNWVLAHLTIGQEASPA